MTDALTNNLTKQSYQQVACMPRLRHTSDGEEGGGVTAVTHDGGHCNSTHIRIEGTYEYQ